MAAAVSVLVPTRNPGSALADLVRAVDSQTLPTAAFELLVVDSSSDGSTGRLQQLSGRRPNVTVLTVDPQAGEADRLRPALERAEGEYVLVVGQHQRLAPRALELLLEKARSTGADIVLGRMVTGATSACTVLPDDADRIDVSEVDLTRCSAMVRRSLLSSRPDAAAALLDLPAVTGEAGTVSALGRYACAQSSSRSTSQANDVSLESPTYTWADGTLRLTVGVRLAEPVPSAARAWLVLTRELAEVALPASIEPGAGDRTTLTASAVLDPRTAEGGSPLADGLWDLRLRLAWPGRELTVPLSPGPARSAVIAGRPYVVRRGGRALQLDAGATRSSVIGPLPRSRTSITETAQGTKVVLDYSVVHVQGDAVLDARLLLDGFGLPGQLVCRDGGARLEVYASSLPGTSAAAVLAGGGRPVPTGLRLRVDGTGRMAFQNAPPPRSTVPGAGAPLVQRLRRRMPVVLEPVVHRLSEVPVLRQTYRRMISR